MPGPPLSAGQPPLSQQQMMMNPQRTLVTVVTNAEPLPLEQKMRQNDSSIFSIHSKSVFFYLKSF
jgi:hypothetical protein